MIPSQVFFDETARENYFKAIMDNSYFLDFTRLVRDDSETKLDGGIKQ